MYSLAVALVICSGIIHSIWNLFTKRSINKVVFLWYAHIVAIVVFSPFAINEGKNFTFTMEACVLILGSMLFHGLYIFLLAQAYSVGDLSHVYPIMRGTAPLLVPILGVSLLNESLTVQGWIGVAVVVAGILTLSSGRGAVRQSRIKPTLLALSVGVSITCYTLVDKAALGYVPPMLLNGFGNVGNMLALLWFAVKSKEIVNEWKINRKWIVLGGVLAPGGYILFLFAMIHLPASQLAPMREIGTVFATFLGIWVLKEQQGTRRLLSAVIITAGVVILGIWGGH